jgi:23S rRNA pseudouridine1911/1915/1917 synthase
MPGRQEDHAAPASGGRLDQVLQGFFPDQSRSRLQQWIQRGQVSIDGRPATRPGFRLRGGESITVRIPPPVAAGNLPEAIPLDIVFEDEDLLVVNKPAGMVVHPSAGHDTGTLVNAVLAHAPDMAGVGGEIRPGIVHRLDRDTSGLVVVAKNEESLKALQAQFHDREVEKVYLALVDGMPPDRRGRIEGSIGRDARHRQRMGIVPAPKGRPATTDYLLRQAYLQHSLLEVMPRTGRTHQIRVHLAFLGCPVAGDRVYGFRRPTLGLARQMLHAWRLRLRLPGQAGLERAFEAPLPEDLLEAMARAAGPVLAEAPDAGPVGRDVGGHDERH